MGNQSESAMTSLPGDSTTTDGGKTGWRLISRRPLALAQSGWLLCALLALPILLLAIPRGYVPQFTGTVFSPPVDAPLWYINTMAFARNLALVLASVISLALAVVIFWNKRDNPGALFVSFYLLAHGTIMAGPLEAVNGFAPITPGTPMQRGMLISPDLISGLQAGVFTFLSLLLVFVFPNGRFVPGWTRYGALLALTLAPCLAYIFGSEWTSGMSPVEWTLIAIYVLLLGMGVYAQVYRYRRVASRVEKQQTKWVVFGFVLNIVVTVAIWPAYATVSQIPPGALQPWWEPLGSLAWWISVSIVPVSLAIAVMGYRLWDIDLIANRAVVYALLSGSVVAIYVLSVVVLGALFHTSGNLVISLLATALVAVLFQPLRERLQRGVNRLMYGERDDPYAVLSRLGQRLEATLAAESVLPVIVETVAQALKLPYAGIALQDGQGMQVAAEYPSPSGSHAQREVIPLTYQSETVGALWLQLRAPGEPFGMADRRLLEQFAHQAGIAAYTVRLTRELQHSRERLVLAREEERRRIRRDLHDGLGPALASLAMQADGAREWTHADPDKTEAALADITVRAQDALQDIRRLVYGLRPPALDELGLVGALRQSAANLVNGLHVEIDAPESLPPLPAAVEVAAFRIAQETLNNIVRHSRAKNCTVRLAVQDALTLEIGDDGIGLPVEVRSGIGLVSLRERAAELGGSCVIESVKGRGTRVIARLPLAARER